MTVRHAVDVVPVRVHQWPLSAICEAEAGIVIPSIARDLHLPSTADTSEAIETAYSPSLDGISGSLHAWDWTSHPEPGDPLDTTGPPLPDPAPPPVFVNEQAGGRRNETSRLARMLRDAGVAAEVRPVRPEDLASQVRRAADRGAPIIGVAGGDGTLRTAGEVLAGSDTVLAPIPFGTLNHFTRRLGLGEPERAMGALSARRAVRVPVGIVDEKIFLNTAIFGVYAEVVRRRDRWRKWLTKWGAAGVASALALPGISRHDIVIDTEGVRLHRTTPLVWVGMGRGSFPFSHLARVEDPRPVLEVVIVRSTHGRGASRVLVRLLWRLLRGKPPRHDPGLEVFHARSLLLRASSPIGTTLDGEASICEAPVFITLQPDALYVNVKSEG